MKQYLLAVHMIEGEPTPAEAEMQRSYQAVDKFNSELMASGEWVFAGGLHPPDTATVVRATAARSSPPTARSPRPRSRSAASGSSRRPTSTRRSPSPPAGSQACGGPVEVRPFQDMPADERQAEPSPAAEPGAVERTFRRECRARGGHPGPRLRRHRPRRGRGPGGLRHRHRALAGRRHPAQPRRLDRHHRAQQGARPAAPRVVAAGPRGRGGGAARRARAGARGGGTSARRPAAAHLHLLSPGARPRGADRAHPAADRRAAGTGDRPCLPCPGADDRAAPGPRQAEDQRRGHPVPGTRRCTSCQSGCPTCSPSSTWCSTRGTRPRRATTWRGRSCAPRRSGWPGCSSR